LLSAEELVPTPSLFPWVHLGSIPGAPKARFSPRNLMAAPLSQYSVLERNAAAVAAPFSH
jgi:hypothetical protein